MDITPRTMSRIIKQNLGPKSFQKTNSMPYIALKENRGGKNQDAYCCCTEKSIKKKSSIQMKKIVLCRKLSINKTKKFMHGHTRKPPI